MLRNRRTLKTAFLFIAMTFSVAAVSGASLDITQGNTLWAHEGHNLDVAGDYTCTSGVESIDIDTAEGTETSAEIDGSGSFVKSFSLSQIRDIYGYGTYDAKLNCSGSSTVDESASFDVNRFSVEKVDPVTEVMAYKGKTVNIEIRGDINGNTETLDDQNTDFSARFLNSDAQPEVYFLGTNNGDTLLEVSIPESVSSGDHTLLLESSYQKDGGVIQNTKFKTDVRPTWETGIIETSHPDGDLEYNEIAEWSSTVQVNRTGTPYEDPPLESSDFYVDVVKHTDNGTEKVYSQENLIESEWQENGKYSLIMTKPPLDLGRYTFTVGLDRPSSEKVANLTVSKYIPFSGTITDSSGQTVSGKMFVEKQGFQRQVQIKNGKYSGNVLPGEYNFTLDFPEAQLLLEGVSLRTKEDARGTIRYDEIPLGEVSDQLKGVTVANSVAVWFGYPFEDGEMTLQYDTTKVNPSNLKVYECVGWNLDGVRCYDTSEWESVGVKRSWIHPTVGTVTFPVTPYNVTGKPQLMNGYMVVKNTPLQLDYVEFSNDRVKKGGTMTISGKVETPSGQAVPNVKISTHFVDVSGEKVSSSSSTSTNSAGIFSLTKAVPDEEGEYRAVVQAEKKPYSSIDMELDRSFETYTEKSISITGPDTEKFYVGSPTSTEFTVINSGQTALKEVKVSVQGFDRQHYSFRKSEWKELGQGENVRVKMDMSLPADFCENQCQEYRTMNVEVTANSDGEKVNDIATVQAQVSKDEPEKSSVENKTDDSGSFSMNLPETGAFLERQGSLNVVLGLTMIFVLILATAIKKRDGDDNRDRRRNVNGNSGRVAAPSVSSNDEDDDEEEEDQEDKDDEDEEEVFECDMCGEEFDTESALDLHKKAIH